MVAVLLHAVAAAGATATSALDPIDRPALTVRSPTSSAFMAAAQAGERIVAVGERGLILLSDNDGLSWRQAPSPTSVTLTAVRFIDRQRGWTVGHGGIVLGTEDGGEHWSKLLDGRHAAKIILAGAQAATDPKAIQDAERLVAEGPDKPFFDILILDTQKLLAVGAFGIALASEDAGRTWTSWMPRLPNPKSLHLYAIRQRADIVLLVGEQGLVLQSTDRGRTFSALPVPYKGSFFTAELPGEREIVIAGLRGTMLRSVDGGANWNEVLVAIPASIVATSLSGDGRLNAINQAGFVMSLVGNNLIPLHTKPHGTLNGMLILPRGTLLALGMQGILDVSPKTGSPK